LHKFAKENDLQLSPVTDSPVSVGTLRVAGASKEHKSNIATQLFMAKREIEKTFNNVIWGATDHSKAGVWSRQFYTSSSLTDGDSYTKIVRGVRVSVAARVTGAAISSVSNTLKHVDARVDETKKAYKAPTSDPAEAKKLCEEMVTQLDDAATLIKEMMRSWSSLRLSAETATATVDVAVAARQLLIDDSTLKATLKGPSDLLNVASRPRKKHRGDEEQADSQALQALRDALTVTPENATAKQLQKVFMKWSRKALTPEEKLKLKKKKEERTAEYAERAKASRRGPAPAPTDARKPPSSKKPRAFADAAKKGART
jgi:hypothetical protein